MREQRMPETYNSIRIRDEVFYQHKTDEFTWQFLEEMVYNSSDEDPSYGLMTLSFKHDDKKYEFVDLEPTEVTRVYEIKPDQLDFDISHGGDNNE